VSPTTPDPGPPPAGSKEPLVPPEFPATPLPWSSLDPLGLDRLGLDQLGLTQSIGGLVLGLIALFSSYDHITFAGRSIPLQQQWGIPFIFASVATVFIDAQLATRSRLRAANEREVDRNRADQERDRAAEARERQAQDAERQNEDLALLRRSALLSARVQLDPNPTNRDRLQFLVTLLDQTSVQDPEVRGALLIVQRDADLGRFQTRLHQPALLAGPEGAVIGGSNALQLF
jgi:hypothetical protein